ncbi:MAG: OsmC family protein [Saprospiraceae bacterium]|nr:OsmC family protein [Candidatus Opimibacter skivensis]
MIVADEPLDHGGKDAGPTPTELVLSGLAACTASTLRMYADKKAGMSSGLTWKSVSASKNRYRTDLSCGKPHRHHRQYHRRREGPHDRNSSKCPVHKLLGNPIQIQTSTKP